MNFKPPPKRKKVDPPNSFSVIHAHLCVVRVPRVRKIETLARSMVHYSQNGSARIQQARNGCTANYKVFDSPFGNYLVPVTPTRTELGG